MCICCLWKRSEDGMRFINLTYENFLKRIENKTVILFGVSSAWHYYHKVFPDITQHMLTKVKFIVDNSVEKQGRIFHILGKDYEVKSVEDITSVENCVILITVSLAYQQQICQQLTEMNLPAEMECFSLPLMTYSHEKVDNSCVEEYFETHTEQRIDAKIHSFWFSGEEKPDVYKRCISSWHKYCPQFEIIEWNGDNYDITQNQYMKEAFEHRKWAFVSDYARLDVIYRYGGIYLDMDVELLAPLEKLLNAESFFCRQEDGLLELGSGFGASAGNPFIKQMLETYKNRRLIASSGEIDMTPQPEWLSDVFVENRFYKNHNSEIIGNCLVLSNDYIMCAAGNDAAERAKLGVHWHNGGWLDFKDRQLIRESIAIKEELIRSFFNKDE